MRIKKYQNWKLNNHNTSYTKNHHSIFQQPSFSISQLLETPTKPSNKQNEPQYSLTNPQVTFNYNNKTNTNHNNLTNLNHRLLHKTQIYLKNNYTDNEKSIFKTQQKTQREQIIKHKIKQRIKQQFQNQQHFNIVATDRTFFNYNNYRDLNNNDLNLRLSFDQGLTQYKQKDISVHVKGKSLPINSFTHKRSKSSVLRSGLVTSTQKHKLFQPQKLKPTHKDQFLKKNKIYSVDMKRQNSHHLPINKKINSNQQLNKTTHNKIFLKDIDPWQFDSQPLPFQI